MSHPTAYWLARLLPRANALVVLLFSATAAAGEGDVSLRIDDELTHASRGRPVTYTITTRNAGPDAATSVRIDATLPVATCTWSCSSDGGACQTTPAPGADLPAGAVSWHRATCVVPADATGTWTASATVQPPEGFTDLDTTNDQSSDTTQVVPRGILGVALSDAPSHVTAGDPIAYTLNVSNAGPDALSGVRVTTLVAPQYTGCTWTCAGSGGATCSSAGSGDVGDDAVYLPASRSVNYAIKCTVTHNATGLATTRATVQPPAGSANINPTPGAGSEDSDSNTILAAAFPDLAVEMTGPSAILVSPPAFWVVNYRIFAINRGAVAATVPFAANFGVDTHWSCATPDCPVTGGTGYQINQTITLPPRSRFEIVVSGMGYGNGIYYATAGLGVAPDDPVTTDNSAGVRTVVGPPPMYPPPTDVSITPIAVPPPRLTLGDTLYYRFRASAPGTANVYATIVLPPYVDDVQPVCAGTTGSATCTIASPLPSLADGNFTYTFQLALNPGDSGDFAVTARVSRRPFADYWNEALRVTASGVGSLDTNPDNNSVDVTTALSLFRGTFEMP